MPESARTIRSRSDLMLWVLAVSIVLTAASASGVPFSPAALNRGPDDPRRAQTPLSEIRGVEATPPVTVLPLDQVPAVQSACDRARSQIDDGRLQAALKTLADVQEQPGADRYEVHYLLALAKTQLGQFDAARASAEAAAQLGHGRVDVHYLLGELCRRQGETESAIAHYRTATLAAERELTNPKVTLSWYFLGETLEQTGYDRAAAEAYERFDLAVWQTHPEQRNAPAIETLLTVHPHGMVAQRLELLKRLGHADDLSRLAEWARDTWPDDPYIARLYAEALLAAEVPERAFVFCQQRLQGSRNGRGLLPTAVEAARAADRLDGWIDELVQQVAGEDGFALALALAEHLNRIEMPAQARRIGAALLERQPGRGAVAWELAAAQRALGDLRGALQTLITYVRNNPDLGTLPQPRLALWMTWFEPGADISGLVAEIRSRPDADFATEFVLGVSALAADEDALADELLQACVAARPDFAPAHVARSAGLLLRYHWHAAQERARRVLEERPQLAAAHFILAQAHEGLDENERAERAYKQAIKLRPEEPAYKLALAEHYRRLQQLLGAQRYFQEVLALRPGDGAALEGLVDCYLRDGKVELARAQLERIGQEAVPEDSLRRINTSLRFWTAAFGAEHLAALKAQFEQYPEDWATARYLAGGLYQWGQFDETLAIVRKVRRARPDDYHFMVLQANVHAVRGEFDQAIELLETLVQRYPNRLTVLQPLALCCVHDFRFDRGRPVLERLIALDQDEDRRREYREKLRESYLIFGECEPALRVVEGWLESDPEDDRLLLHKAIVLLTAERREEAIAALEQWLERAPDDPRRREAFYRYARWTRQYASALERIRAWLEAEPSDAMLTEWLINVLIWADRTDEALEVAEEFEGTYAESMLRRIWLGRCRAARGEIDKALAEFDALLDERLAEDSLRRDVWDEIVTTLLTADRVDDALERCERWLAQAEDLGPALRPIALDLKRRVLQVAGRDRENVEVMKTLLEYVPTIETLVEQPGYNTGLFNDLGYTWVDLGLHLEQATELIQRAVASEPWRAPYIDSLGWACYKAGDFSNARKHLQRAARLRDGQDAVVYDHLADTAYRLGDQTAARRHWEKVLTLIEAALEDTEILRAERARLSELAPVVRAKLEALERSERPAVAPTAEEQHGDGEQDDEGER